jgi:hypothetical protein
MTCAACTQAAAKVSHLFHAGCRGCCARACARGQGNGCAPSSDQARARECDE